MGLKSIFSIGGHFGVSRGWKYEQEQTARDYTGLLSPSRCRVSVTCPNHTLQQGNSRALNQGTALHIPLSTISQAPTNVA